MKDDRVDELLSDLDLALSVEPSPAVAARVRSRIASEPVRHVFDLRWALVIGALAMIVGVWLTWPSAQMPAMQSVSLQPGSPAPLPVPSVIRPNAPTPAIALPRSRPTTSGPDMQVLISPKQQVAMEQLRAALRAGRLIIEAPALPAPERPIVIAPVAIETFKIEPPASPRTSGGRLFERGFERRSGK